MWMHRCPEVADVERCHRGCISEWLASKLDAERDDTSPLRHHLLDQLMHVAYGGALGAVGGLLMRRDRASTWRRGVAFGAATWALGAFVVMPLTGAGRPAWRSSVRENATNLLAHVLYGLGHALLTDELSRQVDRGPTSRPERHATAVG